jgi:L-iditol 2-dehydrogenase
VKAAILEDRLVLAYRDAPEPVVGPGDVLLEVRAVAVCGSDIHRFVRGHRTYPMVMGHEAAGVIGAVGEGVDPALRGRHAALVPLVPDHTCDQCRAGRFSACGAYSFVGSRRDGALPSAWRSPRPTSCSCPATSRSSGRR